MEIGDRIDQHIAQDFDEREVSVGQAVKAMVLNGFGFVQQRLYLTPQFFERAEGRAAHRRRRSPGASQRRGSGSSARRPFRIRGHGVIS
ncbi:DUF4277 domain-containing protein [Salinibacter sp.]|uniref:DUF4277 domain-containing protein n=1 Tax=Salinibacter sp. TaxID=2065818 RepID=UPI003D759C35